MRFHVVGLRFAAVCGLVGLPSVSVPAADYSGLVEQVRAAATSHRALSAADLDAAASQLRTALSRIQPSARKPRAPGQPGIDWSALEKQASNPKEADPALLGQIEKSIASQSHGFDPPEFRGLARAVRRYANVVEASAAGAGKAGFERQLGGLAGVLEKATGADGFGPLEEAGPLLEKLDDTLQAPNVVAEVRRAIGKPNVFVDVHESLLAQAANRPVDEVAPIDEVILGVRQRGTGHTQGFVNLDFVPSQDNATIDLLLGATNHSHTRGGRGPVTVCSQGTTQLNARRRILIDDERAYGLAPEADASAHSETEGIGVRAHLGKNLIRRIASKRADEMRPQGDAIAAGRARERLRSRFESQTQEAVNNLSSNYQSQFREPLLIHELYPEMLHLNTTDLRLHSIAKKMLTGEVGAATSPPTPIDTAVLSARVHQTAVANVASTWLAGRTITKEQVEAEYGRRGVPLPAVFSQAVGDDDNDKGDDGDQKPWSVRFAAQKPLQLEVGDDRVTATLKGEAFTSGERTVGPMNVKATYRLEPAPGGARLIREGDIEIAPPGGKWREGDKPSVDERVIRRRLRKRVETVLKETIDVEPLKLPGQLESAGPLPIEQLTSRKDGWISAGWRKKDPVIYEGPVVEEVRTALPGEVSSTNSGMTGSNGRIQIERN